LQFVAWSSVNSKHHIRLLSIVSQRPALLHGSHCPVLAACLRGIEPHNEKDPATSGLFDIKKNSYKSFWWS
jgi:hypothetical protein